MHKTRCGWVDKSEIYQNYHDFEWGVPQHNDQKLFEMLVLESMQSGLSWVTVLKKREAFRVAFDDFEVQKVALYGEAKVEELMQNSAIIRNKLKILATINNAKCFIHVVQNYGSFDKFIWSYVDFKPIINNWESISELPAFTPLSEKIAKDLKKLGFKFLGKTTMYSFMQGVGMVNDHTKECFLHPKNGL